MAVTFLVCVNAFFISGFFPFLFYWIVLVRSPLNTIHGGWEVCGMKWRSRMFRRPILRALLTLSISPLIFKEPILSHVVGATFLLRIQFTKKVKLSH